MKNNDISFNIAENLNNLVLSQGVLQPRLIFPSNILLTLNLTAIYIFSNI